MLNNKIIDLKKRKRVGDFAFNNIHNSRKIPKFVVELMDHSNLMQSNVMEEDGYFFHLAPDCLNH